MFTHFQISKGRRTLAVRAAMLAGGLTCAVSSAALLGSPAALASQSAVPSSSQLVAMEESPAVQLVSNHESATVTWYRAHADLGKLVAFANRDPATMAAWSHRRYRQAAVGL